MAKWIQYYLTGLSEIYIDST